MRWQDHIEENPEVMLGKPVIKGTRLTVEHLLEQLGDGWQVEQIVESYPQLTIEDVQAAVKYAAHVLALDSDIILREAS